TLEVLAHGRDALDGARLDGGAPREDESALGRVGGERTLLARRELDDLEVAERSVELVRPEGSEERHAREERVDPRHFANRASGKPSRSLSSSHFKWKPYASSRFVSANERTFTPSGLVTSPSILPGTLKSHSGFNRSGPVSRPATMKCSEIFPSPSTSQG